MILEHEQENQPCPTRTNKKIYERNAIVKMYGGPPEYEEQAYIDGFNNDRRRINKMINSYIYTVDNYFEKCDDLKIIGKATAVKVKAFKSKYKSYKTVFHGFQNELRSVKDFNSSTWDVFEKAETRASDYFSRIHSDFQNLANSSQSGYNAGNILQEVNHALGIADTKPKNSDPVQIPDYIQQLDNISKQIEDFLKWNDINHSGFLEALEIAESATGLKSVITESSGNNVENKLELLKNRFSDFEKRYL